MKKTTVKLWDKIGLDDIDEDFFSAKDEPQDKDYKQEFQVYSDELFVDTEYHGEDKVFHVTVNADNLLEQIINQVRADEILDHLSLMDIKQYLAENDDTGDDDYDRYGNR